MTVLIIHSRTSGQIVMMKLAVIGSANTDLTVSASQLPRPGETISSGEFRVSYGGKGANQAVAALRAGCPTTLLTKIGRDPYGDLLFEHLVQSGLGLDPIGLLRDAEMPAGVALIALDREGNNQIVVAPGSNHRLTPQDLEASEHFWGDADLLLLQMEIPQETVECALKLAKRRRMTTILNPAPVAPLGPEIYSYVDILTPNEREASDLTEVEVRTVDDARRAAENLRSRGCSTVIITLGKDGALLSSKAGEEHFPAFPVRSIDSVAAGDAFNGALAAALSFGSTLPEAIRFANGAGALSTTRRGAQESLPERDEIEDLLRG